MSAESTPPAARAPNFARPNAATARPAPAAWWAEPRVLWGFVAVAALLVALRKPWALHTPQLYAEDGSIFLTQDDQLGLRAFWQTYVGYLHLLPRTIAWLASHVADVAWWPAIYNGATFLVTIGLFARFVSPRIDVPGKPWLLLSFGLVAHTGEVLLNVTNLQWLASFFLLQQLVIARPTTVWQRAGDLTLLIVVGLTGPFSLIYLTLFAWRWWRERQIDHLAALLVLGACAGGQGWLLAKAGLEIEAHPEPWRLDMLFAVIGSRLAIWPWFGRGIAGTLPVPALAILGSLLLAALSVWVLRPHPRRMLRAQILGAIVLVTITCIRRVRPDTWETANLENGDRYFYISRVLVAWLLVWEFDAWPRAVALTARGLCVAGALANLPQLILPAPPNYHWAEHCDPIRRGTPANIYTLPEGWWIGYPGREQKK